MFFSEGVAKFPTRGVGCVSNFVTACRKEMINCWLQIRLGFSQNSKDPILRGIFSNLHHPFNFVTLLKSPAGKYYFKVNIACCKHHRCSSCRIQSKGYDHWSVPSVASIRQLQQSPLYFWTTYDTISQNRIVRSCIVPFQPHQSRQPYQPHQPSWFGAKG